MKRPETGAYLAKAELALREARVLSANELSEAAGRAAYQAAFHAAQAFIFEETGRAAKTHNGVRSEFARLSRDHASLDRSFSAFLARAYTFKEVADYAIGASAVLGVDEANAAIASATFFVHSLNKVLSGP